MDESQFIVLDLGSTSFKLATFDSKGQMLQLEQTATPTYFKSELISECDSERYMDALFKFINPFLSQTNQVTRLGLSTQRSSLIAWDRDSGKLLSSMISWKDRRSSDWCQQVSKQEHLIIQRQTGLRLSPHYFATKARDISLKYRDQYPQLAIGTLDSYLIWKLSSGRFFQSDASMAARTLLMDIHHSAWSNELLNIFSIQVSQLPKVTPSLQLNQKLHSHLQLCSSLADQSAALYAIPNLANKCLVNLGTGAFVLSPQSHIDIAPSNYLTTYLFQDDQSHFAFEGTINDLSRALAETREVSLETMTPKQSHNLFCIPDSAGLGSPFWNPKLNNIFSDTVTSLQTKKQVIYEGIAFRIRQIIEDFKLSDDHEIVLSGGLSLDQDLSKCINYALPQRVFTLEQNQASIQGILNLSFHDLESSSSKLNALSKDPDALWLRQKYASWKEWANQFI